MTQAHQAPRKSIKEYNTFPCQDCKNPENTWWRCLCTLHTEVFALSHDLHQGVGMRMNLFSSPLAQPAEALAAHGSAAAEQSPSPNVPRTTHTRTAHMPGGEERKATSGCLLAGYVGESWDGAD